MHMYECICICICIHMCICHYVLHNIYIHIYSLGLNFDKSFVLENLDIHVCIYSYK
jgi:hypothetical protein